MTSLHLLILGLALALLIVSTVIVALLTHNAAFAHFLMECVGYAVIACLFGLWFFKLNE